MSGRAGGLAGGSLLMVTCRSVVTPFLCPLMHRSAALAELASGACAPTRRQTQATERQRGLDHALSVQGDTVTPGGGTWFFRRGRNTSVLAQFVTHRMPSGEEAVPT